jgi:hypothetical protein
MRSPVGLNGLRSRDVRSPHNRGIGGTLGGGHARGRSPSVCAADSLLPMAVSEPELTLADLVLGEALLFFKAFGEMTEGALTQDVVDERIDTLALGIQSTDVARSNPEAWVELAPGSISTYEHLWPCEQIMLFLLANYAAFRVSLGRGIDCPIMAPESIAQEILRLDWFAHEVSNEALLEHFLAHPATQPPKPPE